MPIRQSTMIDLLRAAKAYRSIAHQIVSKLKSDRPLFNYNKVGSAKEYNLELLMTMGDDFRDIEDDHFAILKWCDIYYTDAKIRKNDKNREEQTSKRRFDGVPLRRVASREVTTPSMPDNTNLRIKVTPEEEEMVKAIQEQFIGKGKE